MPRIRRTYDRRSDFESVLRTPSGVAGPSLRSVSERIDRVAFFVAGALYDDGFRLFNNGGAPLFEKRRSGRIFELVFRPAGRSVGGLQAPLMIEAMVSDSRLKAQREAYWTPASQAPALIARCHLGELDIPPRWSLYDAFDDLDAWSEVVEEIRYAVLPWFTRFVRPSALIEKLRTGEIAFVPRDVALELILLERGEDHAVDFLFGLFDDDREFEATIREEHRRIARAATPNPNLSSEHANIATIVSRLGLLSRA